MEDNFMTHYDVAPNPRDRLTWGELVSCMKEFADKYPKAIIPIIVENDSRQKDDYIYKYIKSIRGSFTEKASATYEYITFNDSGLLNEIQSYINYDMLDPDQPAIVQLNNKKIYIILGTKESKYYKTSYHQSRSNPGERFKRTIKGYNFTLYCQELTSEDLEKEEYKWIRPV